MKIITLMMILTVAGCSAKSDDKINYWRTWFTNGPTIYESQEHICFYHGQALSCVKRNF